MIRRSFSKKRDSEKDSEREMEQKERQRPRRRGVLQNIAKATIAEETIAEETIAEATIAEVTIAEATIAEETIAEVALVLDARQVLQESIVFKHDDASQKANTHKHKVRFLCLKRLAGFLSNSAPTQNKGISDGSFRYIISDADVRILASIATGLPEDALCLTRKSIRTLVRALLCHRGSLVHEAIVYGVLFTWMKNICTDSGGSGSGSGGVSIGTSNGDREDAALLRTAALRMGDGRAAGSKHVYSTKYTPVMENLELVCSSRMPRLTPDELCALKSQVPAPYAMCVLPELVWRNVVATDADLFRLDSVLRCAWDMQADVVDVDADLDVDVDVEPQQDCIVCLETKPRRMFAMLSCERHVLCASCVLQHRSAASDGASVAGASVAIEAARKTTRCPMRCQYRCTAIPLAAYEYQVREMEALRTLRAALFDQVEVDTKAHGTLETTLKWQYPAFRVGDFVRLRIAGSVKTWVRVDAVMENGLLAVCVRTYPIFVLPSHDVVLGVMFASTPLNTGLDAEDLRDIEVHSQHSITYGRKRRGHKIDAGAEAEYVGEGEDEDEDEDEVVANAGNNVMHYQLCSKRSASRECSHGSVKDCAASSSSCVWVRVVHPVARNEYSTLYAREEPVYDSLNSLHAALADTHDILPTMLPSACACVEDRGFHISRQVCMRCRRVVCTACFGSVSSVCAFCKACDALGPSIIERRADLFLSSV